ncbi:Uncharacterized protein Fot_52485 [Forsythia ovata]|uniref:Uncharacterized protein n=1 Tax=Forsythia ovata TaxID=205694 RepID=A0ABD1PNH2_9LAMI
MAFNGRLSRFLCMAICSSDVDVPVVPNRDLQVELFFAHKRTTRRWELSEYCETSWERVFPHRKQARSSFRTGRRKFTAQNPAGARFETPVIEACISQLLWKMKSQKTRRGRIHALGMDGIGNINPLSISLFPSFPNAKLTFKVQQRELRFTYYDKHLQCSGPCWSERKIDLNAHTGQYILIDAPHLENGPIYLD